MVGAQLSPYESMQEDEIYKDSHRTQLLFLLICSYTRDHSSIMVDLLLAGASRREVVTEVKDEIGCLVLPADWRLFLLYRACSSTMWQYEQRQPYLHGRPLCIHSHGLQHPLKCPALPRLVISPVVGWRGTCWNSDMFTSATLLLSVCPASITTVGPRAPELSEDLEDLSDLLERDERLGVPMEFDLADGVRATCVADCICGLPVHCGYEP